jgi:hypothetical protein
MTTFSAAVRARARWLTRTVVTCSVLACSVDHLVLAQADRRQFPVDNGAAAGLVARNSSTATQRHLDDASSVPQFENVGLPANLTVSSSLRATVESMLRDSVSFRRQCARVASSPSLAVSVDQALLLPTAPFQAITSVSIEPDGGLMARVLLGSRADPGETLAHELEHIIEQLDGVDLQSLAKRADAGVHRTYDGDRYETERAVAMGRQVAQELRMARRKRP